MDTTKTVLIVDDDDLVLESIDLLLSAVDGFRCIRARGSASAVSHMQHSPVDVIVADVILAGSMSGIDICQKAVEHHPTIAVVVITADPEVHCADIPECGVLLRKPFGGEQLLEAIRVALNKARN
ncbi:response regulator [Rhodanobacter sp. Col0626]|uniref:response regulator n=1 Tax=Rhodanobacter sp. Col0626 TaxID=3415679 RepID=UPI003CED5397